MVKIREYVFRAHVLADAKAPARAIAKEIQASLRQDARIKVSTQSVEPYWKIEEQWVLTFILTPLSGGSFEEVVALIGDRAHWQLRMMFPPSGIWNYQAGRELIHPLIRWCQLQAQA